MDSRKSLLNTFHLFVEALKTCNQIVLEELIADDYQGYSLNGTVENKSDIISAFRKEGVRITSYVIDNMEYEEYGEIGIICGQGRITAVFNAVTFHHEVLFTDIYKQQEGVWKYFRSQVTERMKKEVFPEN